MSEVEKGSDTDIVRIMVPGIAWNTMKYVESSCRMDRQRAVDNVRTLADLALEQAIEIEYLRKSLSDMIKERDRAKLTFTQKIKKILKIK